MNLPDLPKDVIVTTWCTFCMDAPGDGTVAFEQEPGHPETVINLPICNKCVERAGIKDVGLDNDTLF